MRRPFVCRRGHSAGEACLAPTKAKKKKRRGQGQALSLRKQPQGQTTMVRRRSCCRGDACVARLFADAATARARHASPLRKQRKRNGADRDKPCLYESSHKGKQPWCGDEVVVGATHASPVCLPTRPQRGRGIPRPYESKEKETARTGTSPVSTKAATRANNHGAATKLL